MVRSAKLGALVLAACLAATSTLAAERLLVGKPDAKGFNFSPLEVGIRTGIFERSGFDIETVTLAGGAKLHQAMIAGSLDIGLGSGPDLSFIAQGATEKGVAAMAGPPLNMAVVVRPDSGIAQIADLKGRRIGITTVGSLTSWLATELSRRQGWSGEDALKPVALGNFQGTSAALIAKTVDVIVGNREGSMIFETEGRARILMTFGSVVPHFLTHVIFATDAMMAQRPDSIRRFLKGWFETIAWMRANRDEAIALSRIVTDLPPDIAAHAYDEGMAIFLDDGHFDPDAVEVIKRAIIETGMVAALPPNDRLFTEAFLP
jgi:NitT/TauT family transport system substrate-binding protein